MSGKVLCIDDSKTIQLCLQLALEGAGFTVLIAENGAVGLKLLEDNPDTGLIYLDVHMPVMDGFTCLQHIKDNPKTSHIDVIMVTTEGSKVKVERSKGLGASGWIVKPIDENIAVSVAEKYLGKRPA
ncbi:MAG: response regulator [Pseudobacteriovorax sp.]|nr:response regulator [Pseudobacteriovorax sp.]